MEKVANASFLHQYIAGQWLHCSPMRLHFNLVNLLNSNTFQIGRYVLCGAVAHQNGMTIILTSSKINKLTRVAMPLTQ